MDGINTKRLMTRLSSRWERWSRQSHPSQPRWFVGYFVVLLFLGTLFTTIHFFWLQSMFQLGSALSSLHEADLYQAPLAPARRTIASPLDDLSTLDSLSPICNSTGFTRMEDVHHPASRVLRHVPRFTANFRPAAGTLEQRIPRLIFQTSKSRCLPDELHSRVTKRWKSVVLSDTNETNDKWSYYFYDDAAVQRLLSDENDVAAEFPHLIELIQHCVLAGTVLSDLWRYVALYKYGGIYADTDSAFKLFFRPDSILSHDAWLVVDEGFLPSQYFFAVSPRHPLMFYAVHHSMAAILAAPDLGTMHIAHSTGPWALFRAFQSFRQDVGVPFTRGPPFHDPNSSPVREGTWEGTDGRTVTFHGQGGIDGADQVIVREALMLKIKLKFYERMNMTHHRKEQEMAQHRICIAHNLFAPKHMPNLQWQGRTVNASKIKS